MNLANAPLLPRASLRPTIISLNSRSKGNQDNIINQWDLMPHSLTVDLSHAITFDLG